MNPTTSIWVVLVSLTSFLACCHCENLGITPNLTTKPLTFYYQAVDGALKNLTSVFEVARTTKTNRSIEALITELDILREQVEVWKKETNEKAVWTNWTLEMVTWVQWNQMYHRVGALSETLYFTRARVDNYGYNPKHGFYAKRYEKVDAIRSVMNEQRKHFPQLLEEVNFHSYLVAAESKFKDFQAHPKDQAKKAGLAAAFKEWRANCFKVGGAITSLAIWEPIHANEQGKYFPLDVLFEITEMSYKIEGQVRCATFYLDTVDPDWHHHH